jgi:hypothetical protein
MKPNESHIIDAIVEIGKSVLRGSLSIEEFHEKWPPQTMEHAFFTRVYEDMEDAVEHFPAGLLTGKPDRRWETTRMYLVLYLDVLLLSQRKSADELLRCRDIVLRQERLSTETIRQRVEECLGVRLNTQSE